MDMMEFVDGAIGFAKEKIDWVIDFWDNLEEDKKKLLIGCVIGAVSVIVIASIAYGIGKANGKKIAFEEDDF